MDISPTEAMASLKAACALLEAEGTEFRYHQERMLRIMDDGLIKELIAAGEATEAELQEPQELLRELQLYVSEQGDKFHPLSDAVREIIGDFEYRP